MADRTFDTDEERKAYLAGVEDTAKKMQAPPLTLADIRGMSTQEVMARKREVDAVLRQPIVKDGDEDDE